MSPQSEGQVRVTHAANERMFDATSGNYSTEQWFDRSARSPFVYDITRRRLLESLDLSGAEDVFEMGCGPGTWSRVIASRAGSLTSLDISRVMIDRAREFVRPYNVSFVHSDILRYMPERAYERVVSLRAIEYVRDKEDLVARLARLVSEDGLLVIVSKTPFSAWRGRRVIAAMRRRFSRRTAPSGDTVDAAGETPQAAYYHVRISPWRLAGMLRAAGFEGITMRPVIVGLPILRNAEDEGSDLPLIPPALAPRVLSGFNALGDLLSRAPQWTMPLTLWLSESYIIRARKHTAEQQRTHPAARRGGARGGMALLALIMVFVVASFVGFWALKHRRSHP
ncbi:MAG TPA: methyltransferase domain-containing protein [Ktedonobacterales bacterium]|nr:methyltransferase domain-containing protein [Ktedonobacterales bacterium]